MNRFGLTVDGKRKTLEEIGKKYGITRERVRQVEDAAINLIKKSDAYKNEQAV
ncbi:MAG: RNA polymerase, partial [Parcubacteria group bacterium GW2011_GWF2_50_9]